MLFVLKFDLHRLILHRPSWSVSNYLYFLPDSQRANYRLATADARMDAYGHLNYVPHLRGFFEATQGEFRLEPLANGRTYWRLWSDAIVTRIHRRVLEHVRKRSTTLS